MVLIVLNYMIMNLPIKMFSVKVMIRASSTKLPNSLLVTAIVGLILHLLNNVIFKVFISTIYPLETVPWS
jgi:hypothetical protein